MLSPETPPRVNWRKKGDDGLGLWRLGDGGTGTASADLSLTQELEAMIDEEDTPYSCTLAVVTP